MQSTYLRTLKRYVAPVSRLELPVFLPGFFLYFCLSFVYNSLRPLKITLVTAASKAGAEIIPFLKVWGILPGALFFTYLFARFSSRLTREQTFYTIISIFLAFHLCFASLLYPNAELLRLDQLAGFLTHVLPAGCRGFITMLQYWHLSVFYVFCEVWSSAVIFMLYWGFINETTSIRDAARFYPLYNLGGNLASAVAGFLLVELSSVGFKSFLPYGAQAEDQYALTVVYIAVAVGFVAMGLFRILSHCPQLQEASGGHYQVNKKQEAFTMRECFAHVAASKYLFYILVLVVGYNLVFNLTDVLWSQKVKQLYTGDRIAMTAYMGKVTMMKGILSSLLVFVAHLLIQKGGWKLTTLITPLGIFATSLFFFPLIFWHTDPFVAAMFHEWTDMSMLSLAVTLGGLQNVITRGTKYSLYDTSREMAYIPLPTVVKRKGKAVIDGIASRLGKSSGSLVYMILLPFCAHLDATIPFVSVIVIIVSAFWIYSIYKLDHEMKVMMKSQGQDESAWGSYSSENTPPAIISAALTPAATSAATVTLTTSAPAPGGASSDINTKHLSYSQSGRGL